MIKRAKGIELMNFFLIINLNTFGSNFTCVTLKLWIFENVALTKVHIYVIKSINALYMI